MWFWLLMMLLLIWLLAMPAWPYHRRYGHRYGYSRGWYYPFGAISAVLLFFLAFWLLGAIVVTL